jgi:hypothetical protein
MMFTQVLALTPGVGCGSTIVDTDGDCQTQVGGTSFPIWVVLAVVIVLIGVGIYLHDKHKARQKAAHEAENQRILQERRRNKGENR